MLMRTLLPPSKQKDTGRWTIWRQTIETHKSIMKKKEENEYRH